MNLDQIISSFAIYALPVIFAITLHEAAHAFAAKYFGDNTAFDAGRMSLNPLRHIDPFGTIALPILTFALSYAFAPFVFGYAKPVPVEFSRLRKPKQQMAWVALAGPAANFFMALGWLVLLLVLRASGVAEAFPNKVAQAGVFVNLILFAINLLPIPPLDGGRILTSLLPNRLAYKFAQVERFGFFVIIALLVTGMLQYWMQPVMSLTYRLLDLLVLPLKLLLS